MLQAERSNIKCLLMCINQDFPHLSANQDSTFTVDSFNLT